MTPMLRPGLRVARRDAQTLQVGLAPGRRALLPDSPETRTALETLSLHSPAVEALAARGLLVDRDDVVTALARVDPFDAVAQGAVTAAFAQHGQAAAAQLRTRTSATVSVEARSAMATWAGSAVDLLCRSGIAARIDAGPVSTMALVLSDGEPDRDRFDLLLRTGQPSLLLTAREGAVRLGPFVVPGVTACLRCVDAHLGERDERRGVVVAQHTSAVPEVTGLPAPLDPALLTMAIGWAVRDVLTFVAGDQPSSWSATVDLEPDLALTRHHWRRHPHCGCCWGDLLDVV